MLLANARFALIALEAGLLFIGGPLGLYFFATTRELIYAALMVAGLYAFLVLRFSARLDWTSIWRGKGWPKQAQVKALRLFLACSAGLVALTLYLAPERFFLFPIQRPVLWLAVMIFYPLISVVPQELFFRSFFFARYEALFPKPAFLVLSSAFSFGLAHLMLDNWIAPVFSGLAGMIFAAHYNEHRSLKWAVIEHGLYGNVVFTVGIGWYFFTGNWRP